MQSSILHESTSIWHHPEVRICVRIYLNQGWQRKERKERKGKKRKEKKEK